MTDFEQDVQDWQWFTARVTEDTASEFSGDIRDWSVAAAVARREPDLCATMRRRTFRHHDGSPFTGVFFVSTEAAEAFRLAWRRMTYGEQR